MGRHAVVVAAALAAALAVPAIAPAAQFPVSSTADVADANPGAGGCDTGAGVCTLRAAVQEANAVGGPDTITLPAGNFALSIPGAVEDLGVTGDLDVSESVEIRGAGSGAGGTTIQGAPAPSERVLQTVGASTDLTVASLRITGSNDPTQTSVIAGDGRSLTLSDVVIAGNTGRQILYQFGPGGTSPFFTMTNSTISGNTSTRSLVEIGSNGVGRATLTDSSISGNTLNGGSGFPSILDLDNGTNDSRVDIVRTTLSGNNATGSEGVVDFNPSGAANAAGDHLSITDSVFSDNRTDGGEGAIQFDPSASGTTTPMALSLTRTRFLNNVASPTGSGSGGAVLFAPSGGQSSSLIARDSTFQGNVAGGAGSGSGGAVEFDGGDGSALVVTGSTFAANRAGTTAGSASEGGAIAYNAGQSATLSITNSTFSENSVTATAAGSNGGAIAFHPGTATAGTLTNVTIAGNGVGAAGEAGGLATDSNQSPALTLRNSIIAANTDGGAVSDCAGPVISGGGNIEGATTCALTGGGDRQNTNPLLGPLADNGGPTQTRALLVGSPAINGALASTCPAADQRGVSRPQLGACDIGAFELSAAFPVGTATLEPVLGKLVKVEVLSGRVYFSQPGPAGKAVRAAYRSPIKGRKFIRLSQPRLIPVGSLLDTRVGRLRLTSATEQAGKVQSGIFTAGVFKVLQSARTRAKGLTELRLKGASFKSCVRARKGAGRRASTSRRARRIRRLRANAKGRFRTRGRYSAATVRGTAWDVTDRCDGTLTNVTRGTVIVRDFRRKKNIRLRSGKSYLARAKR